ncbi:winged helix-turn-helix domain-containing protein [Streptomyces sp. H27-D2]|uniref:winged helix-turn-helix domain-containing protein n=1 Tax=Streptomyces sp. H27-D2 TaxID=3046304 RepID=UPI002DBBE7FC|nr:GntR family transcriptional regulator [Streptomyces sp. H27-D2]MEC4015684.1 GntR family transcriptional regulator [Streptomyces sp. H27-D2]
MTPESAATQGRKLSPEDVARALRDRIRAGTLQPGDRLPTQQELASEFSVPRGAVRAALKVLRSERLLTDMTKGSPATIARPPAAEPGAGFRPQTAMAALAPRILAAFAARHVEIDAYCLTAATLTLALGKPLEDIHAGRILPERITIRLLMPSSETDLAFPKPVDDGDDDRPHRRWLAQRNAQARVLRDNLLRLRGSHGIEIDITLRAVSLNPTVELYLLNNSEALFAFYPVKKHAEEFEQDSVEMYDTLGMQSVLFALSQDSPELWHATFVEQALLYFNSHWENITSELKLG